MEQSIRHLIDQYTEAINLMEEDRRNGGISPSNAYLTGKIGVYAKVVEDLMEILNEND